MNTKPLLKTYTFKADNLASDVSFYRLDKWRKNTNKETSLSKIIKTEVHHETITINSIRHSNVYDIFCTERGLTYGGNPKSRKAAFEFANEFMREQLLELDN